MQNQVPRSSQPAELVRVLGVWSATAIGIGAMIGTAIFLVSSEMVRALGSIGLVFAAWIAGGILTLFGALSYAELGAAMPEAGGEYVYLKNGFGPLWGFLYGWMRSTIGATGGIATVAAGLLRFLGFLIPAVAAPLFTWHISLPFSSQPYDFIFTAAQPLAAAFIVLVTFINYLGVRLGGIIQIIVSSLKIVALLAIVVLGFILGHGHAIPPLFPQPPRAGVMVAVLAALVPVLWAYQGWSNISQIGSEISDPQKNVPRSLVMAVLSVVCVYLLANAVYFYVLPLHRVAQSSHLASDVVESFGGHRAAQWLTVAMVVSAFGTLNSDVLSLARVPYAMSRDGLFFGFTRHINPTFHTPGGALIFQGTVAGLLALTGTYEELYSLVIFALWIFYGLTAAALIHLRITQPNLHRPYRIWGYPWVPGLFLLAAAALTVNLWMVRPVRSSIGLALILSGVLFYHRWRPAAPLA